ncbi:hypothetical protein BS47DRAFT_1482919 [Hydnum rufescens UP504]|uniref:Actin interacting protein 3 C-terminal domain-containing protein n=1 Tax=Hydnum rufescens UP504 TaxID=1448309 RepID=A0A9P6B5V0_9AGAM|nr:hypothetical protein BS47DRAFT_1482919 [Hydnum rufescens UP504]
MSSANNSTRDRPSGARHQHNASSSSVSGSGASPAVESAVTRLLVAIKQLLEALTYWSTGKMTDLQVSDVYVQLGNDFNSAVAAFAAFRIDMSELLSVPEDLRHVLEDALAEEASPAVLEVYLPKVRAIITNLLQGLRSKQSIYRRSVADRQERKARAESSSSSSTTKHERGGSSTSRPEKVSSGRKSSRGPTSEPPDPPRIPEPSLPRSHYSQRTTRSEQESRTPVQREVELPPETIPHGPSGPSFRNSADPNGSAGADRLSRLASVAAVAEERLQADSPPSRPSTPSQRPSLPIQRSARTSGGGVSYSRTFPAPPRPSREDDGIRRGQSQPSVRPASRSRAPTPDHFQHVSQTDPIPEPLPSPSSKASSVPSHVKRYSLSDNPMPDPPQLHVEVPSPRLDDMDERGEQDVPSAPQSILSTPSMAGSTLVNEGTEELGVEQSLAALQRSEALERRASKRFSTYTFSKMVGGGPGDRTNRKSMLASSSLLTAGDLNAVAEDDETPMPSPVKPRRGELSRKKSLDSIRKTLRALDEREQAPLPPVPPVPRSISPGVANGDYVIPRPMELPPLPPPNQVNGAESPDGRTVATVASLPLPFPSSSEQSAITVFLQVDRHVKKVNIEPAGLSFAALRVLFVDKFSYNPGASNFPSIYIRDPSSGVQYELEDVEEVQDKCLLSLNIEPLDQIKQHIDSQISMLSQDLKELRSTVISTRRQSVQVQTHVINSSPVSPERPTEKQFQKIAKRLTRVMTLAEMPYVPSPTWGPGAPAPPIVTALAPQTTGSSLISDERALRMVADLKTQVDEVQNLRRDLGVMRQIYIDFMNSTKESLGSLRTQAHAVRELANPKVGGARAYIDTGKAKLDIRSQDILTKVDDLQDTVEALRDDVIKRQISPKVNVMKALKTEISASAQELETLKEYIGTIKPMWKQTWEEELQNIVEEQQFLNHQEEFVKDLLEDHKALTEVYEQVEQVISLRGSKSGRGGLKFRVAAPEEGHEGLSTVMLEIRGAAVDPSRRMKAIEANLKMRDRELASRSDEFQDELSGFVAGKKLKMTGGADEVERVRQKRNDLALKAMFSTAPLSTFHSSPASPSSPLGS